MKHARQQHGPVHLAGAEQLKTIVIDRYGKRQRLLLRHAPGDQTGQPEVNMPPSERVDKQVRAFTGCQHLGQQNLRCGQG